MSTYEWIMVGSILAAPLLAVQAQKTIETARERRTRRLRLFHTLMATRAARTSVEHVQALNMIDLEFYGRRFLRIRFQSSGEKAVVDAWREYRDHLNNHPSRTPTQDEADHDERLRRETARNEAWFEKGKALFVSLLHCLSRCLGYDFDRVELEKGAYSPEAHSTLFLTQLAVQEWLLGLAKGTQSLPIAVSLSDSDAEEGRNLRRALTEALQRSAVRLDVGSSSSTSVSHQ